MQLSSVRLLSLSFDEVFGRGQRTVRRLLHAVVEYEEVLAVLSEMPVRRIPLAGAPSLLLIHSESPHC